MDTDLSRLWRSEPPTLPLLERLRAQAEATTARADVVICVTNDDPGYFPDEVYTTCADCGIGIHHRPYVPAHTKKVCLSCGVNSIEEVAGW